MSARVFDPATQCLGKTRHQSKKWAKETLRRMHARNRGNLQVYRCPHCDFFHIGNKVTSS